MGNLSHFVSRVGKAAFLSVTLFAIALVGQDFDVNQQVLELAERSNAVGLLEVSTIAGSYTCSAFTINGHYWLSAGHCAPESAERGTKQEDNTLIVHPIQNMPTPADIYSPPIVIDGSQARFVRANEKWALFYRMEPTDSYFPMLGSAPTGLRAWVYATRSKRLSFGHGIEYAKIPLEAAIVGNNYRGYELIVGVGSMPGFSGAPVLVRAGSEYYAVGLIDAMEIALYIIYYLELPIVGQAESPYSLAYGLDPAEIESWIAEDSYIPKWP